LPGLVEAKEKINTKKLDKMIRNAMKIANQPGLAMAIVKDGKILFMKGYGVRNLQTNEKVNSETLFNIASLSKAFTAALMSQLVEQGKIDWEDAVIDHCPSFKMSDPWVTRHLTMRDLLSHRLGYGTFDGDPLWYETHYSPKEIISRMVNIPLRQEFRSQFGYQNNTYIVAGEIIRNKTGKSWGEVLKEELFTPLRMNASNSTGTNLSEKDNLALPYVNGVSHPNIQRKQNPAASIFTNVSDMTHWMTMMMDGGKWEGKQLLKEQSIENLFSPNIVFPSSKRSRENGTLFRAYALGWSVSDYYGHRKVEHSGGMPGYLSLLTLLPDEKLGVVTLINDMTSLPRLVNAWVLDEYLGKNRKRDWLGELKKGVERNKSDQEKRLAQRVNSRLKNTVPSVALDEYVAEYEDKVYGAAKVELKNGKLYLTLIPTAELFSSEMTHWHLDTFEVEFKDKMLPKGYVTFSFDSYGRVMGFKIDLPNPDFHFYQMDFMKKKGSPL